MFETSGKFGWRERNQRSSTDVALLLVLLPPGLKDVKTLKLVRLNSGTTPRMS